MLTGWFDPHDKRIEALALPNIHGRAMQILCSINLQVYGFKKSGGGPGPSHSALSRTNRNPKEIS
jgi:hypothetical protein